MGRAWVLALIAGCSFEPPVGEVAPDARRSLDATPGTADAPPQQPPPPDAPRQVTCTTSDGALQVCLELEDPSFASGTALDGSGHDRDASLDDVAMATRDVPAVSHAAGFSS